MYAKPGHFNSQMSTFYLIFFYLAVFPTDSILNA